MLIAAIFRVRCGTAVTVRLRAAMRRGRSAILKDVLINPEAPSSSQRESPLARKRERPPRLSLVREQCGYKFLRIARGPESSRPQLQPIARRIAASPSAARSNANRAVDLSRQMIPSAGSSQSTPICNFFDVRRASSRRGRNRFARFIAAIHHPRAAVSDVCGKRICM